MRRTQKLAVIDDLQLAQRALEDMPCGGVGHGGVTLSDIEECEIAGIVHRENAEYHQAQKAWLLIERAIGKVMA